MRITQNAVTRNYFRNLNRNAQNLAKSSLRLASSRRFSKVSENVSDAARAFQVRDQLNSNEQYLTNIRDAQSELTSAESNLTSIKSAVTTAYERLLQGRNGTMSDTSREALASEVASLKDQILQEANAKVGTKYLFGGTNNTEAPFKINDSGKLLYNGINVDLIYKNSLGVDVYLDGSGAEQVVPQNKDIYIDVGLGMTVTSGNLDTRSAVKLTTSGLDAMGFGTTNINGESVPNNLYNLLSKIEKDLKDNNKDSMDNDLKHVLNRSDELMLSITDIGSRSQFLTGCTERVETENLDLQEIQKNVEGISYEQESIYNKSYDMLWNISLQLGTKILPTSIFDFMR